MRIHVENRLALKTWSKSNWIIQVTHTTPFTEFTMGYEINFTKVLGPPLWQALTVIDHRKTTQYQGFWRQHLLIHFRFSQDMFIHFCDFLGYHRLLLLTQMRP